MATFPENPITGSPLIGTPTNPNPITVNVIPQAHQTAWTFHRVMLRVYAALAVPDGNDPNYPSDDGYTELEFSQPVASNDVVQFDVSSALQAVSDRYKPGSEPVTQNPYVKFRIEAWDEWMVDGTTHTTDAALLPGTVVYLSYKKNHSPAGLDKYIVAEDGEDFHAICQRFALKEKAVLKLNGLKKAPELREGDEIKLR